MPVSFHFRDGSVLVLSRWCLTAVAQMMVTFKIHLLMPKCYGSSVSAFPNTGPKSHSCFRYVDVLWAAAALCSHHFCWSLLFLLHRLQEACAFSDPINASLLFSSAPPTYNEGRRATMKHKDMLFCICYLPADAFSWTVKHAWSDCISPSENITDNKNIFIAVPDLMVFGNLIKYK